MSETSRLPSSGPTAPTADEIDRLLQVVESSPKSHSGIPDQSSFESYFLEWAREFDVRTGGKAPSVPSYAFYRHFLAWAEAKGRVFELTPYDWRTAFTGLGLTKVRKYHQKNEAYRYLLSSEPAAYFRLWAEENIKPGEQLEFAAGKHRKKKEGENGTSENSG